MDTFWVKSVLENSLYSTMLLQLNWRTRPDAIERPWTMVLEVQENESHRLPVEAPIIDVFDEMGRALLILGAPGSGKTTTLLELTRDLVARAQRDPAEPVPVVFNLSSWAARRPLLIDWMTEELSSKYQIPRDIGRKWLEANDLLPLLDGLDEVRAEYREPCVDAINQYRQRYGLASLAVCSRNEDYALLTKKLALSGAIMLQPLTETQVDSWLAVAGDKLAELRAAVNADTDWNELAKSPLMLSVMSIAYEDASANELAGEGSSDGRRKRLFDAYIRRMFGRRGDNQPYLPERLMSVLAWLARCMTADNQSVFLIEHLQPKWLADPLDRFLYGLISRTVVGTASGLLAAAVCNIGIIALGLEIFSLPLLYVASAQVIGSMLAGLVVGILYSLEGERATMSASPPYSKARRLSLPLGLIFGLISGLFVGILAAITLRLADAIILGCVSLIVLGITGELFWGIRGREASREIQTVESLGWSWRGLFRGSCRGCFFGVISAGGIGLLIGTITGLVGGLALYPSQGGLNAIVFAATLFVIFTLSMALLMAIGLGPVGSLEPIPN